jgi:long-chain acyl-CoA synthetase
MIIRGGFKLYPSEIENTILKNDLISQCCVVAIPSEQYGNEPVAYIVLKDNVAYKEEEIREQLLKLCSEGLPEYSIPSDIVIIDKMPLTSVGKIDYKKLEASYGEKQKSLSKNFNK